MNFEYRITDIKKVPVDGTVIEVNLAIIATDKEKYFIDAPTGTELFGQKITSEKHYTSVNYINIELEKNENLPFISFNELNENIVLEWVKNKLGKEKLDIIENNLKEQINNQKVNTLSGLSWSNT
jgi:hypothetical protein